MSRSTSDISAPDVEARQYVRSEYPEIDSSATVEAVASAGTGGPS